MKFLVLFFLLVFATNAPAVLSPRPRVLMPTPTDATVRGAEVITVIPAQLLTVLVICVLTFPTFFFPNVVINS